MKPVETALLNFYQKLDSALNAGQVLDSCRVFHGRGKYYEGLDFLTVDFYSPVLLITFFFEPNPDWELEFTASIKKTLHQGITAVVLQRRYVSGAPSEVIVGELPEIVNAKRGDLLFSLSLANQQNTGFFLDMEPGRRWLENICQEKSVLNLFSYTCAFSVVAIAAGAASVVNVDMSRSALNVGRTNHRINQLDPAKSRYLAEDILKSWGRIKRAGEYDIVIIDPPSYQKGSFIAEKDYGKVVRRLPELMPRGGMILACLNAPELSSEFLIQQFIEYCPSARFIERLANSDDFPDIDPEKALKLFVFQLDV